MRPAVLISGAAKRVGAALALHFAENGYDIALHYHESKAEAQKIAQKITKTGASCAVFSHDLHDISGIFALMKRIKQQMPHCCALINNASIFERGEFLQTDETLFDRQFTVNFKAPFFMTQAFAKTFGKGSVINMLDTDIAQMQGSHFSYLLSKKTLAEFTTMAALALGPKIRVNGVCPGYVLPHSAQDAAYIKRIEKELPLKEHATLADITGTVLWLCQQKHITGQIMYIDGGKHVL